MKTSRLLPLLPLLAAAAAPADAQPPPPPGAPPPFEQPRPGRPRLDDVAAVARHHAARLFHISPTNLWFSDFQFDYPDDGPDGASAATVPRRLSVTFFDPRTVAPDTALPGRVEALAYTIVLAPDGRVLGQSGGGHVGWTP
mgnify:CR=1 FL=1